MDTKENILSITSDERIAKLITEAQSELTSIQPEINYLEECIKKLAGLKDQELKLNSMIISLKSLLKNQELIKSARNNDSSINSKPDDTHAEIAVDIIDKNNCNTRKIFLPDQAVSHVKNFLRTKNNLNYEIFKAVVFNSGQATTPQIKQYLVENHIKQPKSGLLFDNVELKEISSRANYLVRKNILFSPEPVVFRSVFGWCDVN